MKTRIRMVALLGALVLALAACTKSPAPEQTTQEQTTEGKPQKTVQLPVLDKNE